MGDPKKTRSKYKGPSHPWESWRIEEERIIKRNYGLKNKSEIWKATSGLRRLNAQAKKLIRERGKGNLQAEKEQKQLLERLFKLGLVNDGATLEDVLALELKSILDRRLQAIVFKSGMTLTSKQARQFIVHGGICVNGRKITVPSYLVSREEQFLISFNPNSSLASEGHPERAKRTQIREAAEKKRAAEEEAAAEETRKLAGDLTEEELKKIEKEIGEVVAK
ncbi:30S ribosomal protein S4 [Candidatus Woesearchaeota archaeon]|nr:30S ribosomal protein S4 [Candidatus Woesearchaeota archaeon]